MVCHAYVSCACKLTYNFDDQTVIMRPFVQAFDLKAISDYFSLSLQSVSSLFGICFQSVFKLVSNWIPSGIASLQTVFQSVPICLEGAHQ